MPGRHIADRFLLDARRDCRHSAPMKRETHLRVWHLAGPIIISNISVPMLGAVDTAVMGHLPDAKYLGGVAIGAMVFTFI